MLVRFFKAARIQQQQRSKRLRGRPDWQDTVPDTEEGKQSYKIAAKHEGAFSRAFLEAIQKTLPGEMTPEVQRALDSGSLEAVLDALPFYQEGIDDPKWEKFRESLEKEYAAVMEEAGEASTRITNKRFGTKEKFSMLDVAAAGAVGMVVNPYARKWIRERLNFLMTEVISQQQRETVREVLEDGLQANRSARAVYRDVGHVWGLTPREARAVANRRALHEAAGLPEAKVETLTEKYEKKLLSARAKRISRTETILAQSEARQEAWQLAADRGVLPDVLRVWETPPPSPNPSRPCPICLDLDGRSAPLGEPYVSTYGEFMTPGETHPGCRCTESLQRAENVEPKPMEPAPINRPPAPPESRALTRRPAVKPAKRGEPKTPRQKFEEGLQRVPIRETVNMPRTGETVVFSARQQQADRLARYIGRRPDRYLQATPDERRLYLTWNWVNGSNAKIPIYMKEALRRERKLGGIVWNPRKFKIDETWVRAIRKDVRDIYKETQAELKARGIKKLKVHRRVKTLATESSTIESWSTDMDVDPKFGPHLLTKEVPADRIFNYRGSRNWVDGRFGDQKEVMVTP